MHFTQAIAAAILAVNAFALPVAQLAGEGSAANSILSDTDNGVGYGTENAEDNLAKNVGQVKGAVPAVPAAPATRRQLAGEGSAADSILTDTDSGIGYGVENAEDNTANLISSVKGGSTTSGGSNPPPPPPPGKVRRQPLSKRQLDKISNGAGAVLNAAGAGTVGNTVQSTGDSVDGSLTNAGAQLGASVGSTEESTLENAGSSVPKSKRQLDKISNGAGAIGSAAGVGAISGPAAGVGDSVDGTLTGTAAQTGASVGSTEETTLENAGSSVPKKFRA